jgi:PIN domain nuclease of toxin-antitoxin system
MSRYITDTHALIWYLTANPKLSAEAKHIFQNADIGSHQIIIPSIVLIEMVYLVEKGRIHKASFDTILELLNTVEGSYAEAPLNKETVKALQHIPRSEVPDMPDRIIAATAYQFNLPLITRDEKIKKSKTVKVIW